MICIGATEWEVYRKGNGGRAKMQIDLGIQLMSHAIELEWTDLNKDPPDWMQQATLIACKCDKCFFVSMTLQLEYITRKS